MNPTVLDVEVTRLLKKIGQPDKKEPPDWIGHESCDDDGPRLWVFKQAEPMDFPGALTVLFIAVTFNVSQFVSAKALLLLRLVVKWNPEKEPDKPGEPSHDERPVRAPGERNPGNDDWVDD